MKERKSLKRWMMCVMTALMLCSAVIARNSKVEAASVKGDEGGVEVTVNGFELAEMEDKNHYYLLSMNVSLANWELEPVSLEESVSAVYDYLGRYEFRAKLDFGGKTQIQMLQTVNGTMMYELPEKAAFAKDGEVTVTITALGRETVADCPISDLNASLKADAGVQSDGEIGTDASEGFSFADKVKDELQLHIGDFYLLDEWQGETEDDYCWLVQEFEIMNWSTKTVAPGEELSSALSYLGKYNFDAEMIFGRDELDSLEQCTGKMVFKIPSIVASSEAGTLVYNGTIQGRELEQTVDMADAKMKEGAVIKFGHYEQDNDTSNGPEEIKWRVMAAEGNRVLLISEYALDAKPYNEKYTDITWENCTLREWLNGEFLQTAFNSGEQGKIETTHIINDDNPSYGTNGGNDTYDKVFLLSIEEVNNYFSSDDERKAVVTKFAEANGAYVDMDCGGTGWWCLRSPGNFTDYAANVLPDGSVDNYGNYVYITVGVVRPALWINQGS